MRTQHVTDDRPLQHLTRLAVCVPRYQYVLGERTWVEYWPTEVECQKPEYRTTCLGMDEMQRQYELFGCEQ